MILLVPYFNNQVVRHHFEFEKPDIIRCILDEKITLQSGDIFEFKQQWFDYEPID